MTKTQPVNTEILPVDKEGVASINERCGSLVTVLNPDQYASLLESASSLDEDDAAITITAIYKEFVKDESVVGIFTGFDGITPSQTNELTGEVEKRFCRSVQWMGKDGKLYQCAGVALVNQFWDEDREVALIEPGTKVKITHTGKSNRTKLYEVGIIQ